MRRLVVAAGLLVLSGVSGLSCVADRGGESDLQPYPVYAIPKAAPGPGRAPERPARVVGPHRPVELSVPRSWFPPRGRISPRWTTIVVHHSATDVGGARRFDKQHREGNGWDELGYHFVIGNGTDTPDGYVEVGSRWYKQKHGAHCKTPNNYYNEHGIGICLVGDFTRSHPTPRQLASLERLVRFLSVECRIPPSRVTTHGAVTHRTQCPGRHFPLAWLRRAASTPMAASSLP